MKPLKLDLGGGFQELEGFTNVDLYENPAVDIVHDIETKLPFEDNSVDEIRLHHSLEHCAMQSLPGMALDWYRVLKPGGQLRIVVPEIEGCMSNFLAASEDDKWGWRIEYILGAQHNNIGQQFHKSAFTPASLQKLVESVHFVVDSLTVENNGKNDCVHLLAHKI